MLADSQKSASPAPDTVSANIQGSLQPTQVVNEAVRRYTFSDSSNILQKFFFDLLYVGLGCSMSAV